MKTKVFNSDRSKMDIEIQNGKRCAHCTVLFEKPSYHPVLCLDCFETDPEFPLSTEKEVEPEKLQYDELSERAYVRNTSKRKPGLATTIANPWGQILYTS